MLVRGFFRTLKLCFESMNERRVPESHAIVPWLLVHTCLILNATVKGPDGLMAWFRVRGRHFHHPMVSFAEQVLYKLPTKGPLSRPDGNMETGWLPATYLGHNVATNNYILAGPHGIEESRAVQRRPESEKLSVDALSDVAATPWSSARPPRSSCELPRPRRDSHTKRRHGRTGWRQTATHQQVRLDRAWIHSWVLTM